MDNVIRWGLASLLMIAGCTSASIRPAENSNQPAGELVVFAAASLAEVFPQLAAAFEEANPGVSVRLNFAGSQRLRTQLEFGADGDVFVSADRNQMDLAVKASLVSRDLAPFASNSLAVIAPAAERPGSGKVQDLTDLARPGVKLALALPAVPIGLYTRDMLDNLERGTYGFDEGYSEKVLGNAVTLETNVRSVVQKVVLGEVDAAIVYQTNATTGYAATNVRTIPIPDAANVAAGYYAAGLKDSGKPDLAAAFIQFVHAETAQAILASHGFGPAMEKRGATQAEADVHR